MVYTPQAFTSIKRCGAMQGRDRGVSLDATGFACWVNASLLDLVLGLRRGDRLPLHVLRRVRSAAFQRHDVIHHEAGAGTCSLAGCRARMLALELVPGSRVALDAAVGITNARVASGRGGARVATHRTRPADGPLGPGDVPGSPEQ